MECLYLEESACLFGHPVKPACVEISEVISGMSEVRVQGVGISKC